jgi:hypothetical protein
MFGASFVDSHHWCGSTGGFRCILRLEGQHIDGVDTDARFPISFGTELFAVVIFVQNVCGNLNVQNLSLYLLI